MSHILIKIIIASLKISFLSFGGGVAVISMIHKEFVERYSLISEDEFHKLVILANSLPGLVIVQLCVMISYTAYSYTGAIVAFSIIVFSGPLTLLAILILLSNYISQHNLKTFATAVIPTVMAMVFTFCINIIKKDRQKTYQWLYYYLIFFSVLILLFLKINIIAIFFPLIIILWLFDLDEKLKIKLWYKK